MAARARVHPVRMRPRAGRRAARCGGALAAGIVLAARAVAGPLGTTQDSTAVPAGRFDSPAAWVRTYPGHLERVVGPLANWRRDMIVGAGAGLAVLVAHQADGALEERVRDRGPWGHGWDAFGSDDLPWVLAAGYLAPSLAAAVRGGDGRAGLGDVEAFLEAQAAQALLIQAVKVSVDRQRPNGNRYSFPSGHTGFAFTSAGLIHGRYGHAAGAAGYAGAAFVASTRITLRRHWLSDTVAGAALGAAIGELVAAAHRRERGGGHSPLSVEAHPQGAVARLQFSFPSP